MQFDMSAVTGSFDFLMKGLQYSLQLTLFATAIGIFFGTITFAIVNQGIYFTDFDRNWSSLIIGIMLLLAVLMNNTFRQMALSYTPKKK